MIRTSLAATALALLLASPAAAHDPGLSSLRLELGPDALHATLRLRGSDLGGGLSGEDAEAALVVRIDGRPARPGHAEVRSEKRDHWRIELAFSPPPRATLWVESRLLDRLPHGHRQYAELTSPGGVRIADRLLDRHARVFQVSLSGDPPAASVQIDPIGPLIRTLPTPWSEEEPDDRRCPCPRRGGPGSGLLPAVHAGRGAPEGDAA